MKQLFFILVLLCFSACEGEFAGDRSFNVQNLSGPYRMRLITLNNTQYLAVLNTNFNFKNSSGSVQFYTLTAPTAPVKEITLSVEVPSNSSDFWVEGSRLFVLDRNENVLLIYALENGVFKKQSKTISLTSNPTSLVRFLRASDGVAALAIAAQNQGTIHFIRLDTLEMINPGEATTLDRLTVGGLIGAKFDMTPRQEEAAGKDDPLSLSFPQTRGMGINKIIFLGGTSEVFVTALATGSALFGFHFQSFLNASNLTWNLSSARDGTTSGGQKITGTDEDGIRGLAQDQSGFVFASNRSDNGIYRIPREQFERTKGSKGENTRGFKENTNPFRLPLSFDTDVSDTVFPRLGDLVVDCPPAVDHVALAACQNENGTNIGTVASRVWSVGLGTKKVYRVNGIPNTPAMTESVALSGVPQRILWHPQVNFLYVACPDKDTIFILNADTLALQGQIQN